MLLIGRMMIFVRKNKDSRCLVVSNPTDLIDFYNKKYTSYRLFP